MPIFRVLRIDLAKRTHAYTVAAFFETVILALLILWGPMLVGAHSILPLVLVVLFFQFPTSLVAIGVFWLLEGQVELDTAFTVCATIMYIGQIVFLGWWLNFRERKAKWDPTAA